MPTVRRVACLLFAVPAIAASPALGRPPHAGSLDRSFGDRGRVVFNLPGERMRPRAMLVQPDRKIVVAGYLTDSGSQYERESFYGRAFAARLLPDGALDPTFGDGGVARARLHAGLGITGIGMQPDGALLLAGSAADEPGHDLGAVVRLRPNGSVDGGFGNGGLATIEPENITGSPSLYALTQIDVHPDGRILVAGNQRAYDVHDAVDPFMARLLPTGAPDPTFDQNGTARAGPQRPTAIARQPDGDLVVFGTNDYYFGGGALTAHRVSPSTATFPLAQQLAPDVGRAYEWKRPLTGAAAQVRADGGAVFAGGLSGRLRQYLAWVRVDPELELVERGKTPTPGPVSGGTFDRRGALITTSGFRPYVSLGIWRFRGSRFHHDRSFGNRDGQALLPLRAPGEFMGMAMQGPDKLVAAGYRAFTDPAADQPLTLYRLHARQDVAPPSLRLAGPRRGSCLDSPRRLLLRVRDESRFLVRISVDGRRIASTRRHRSAIALDPAKLTPDRHRLTVIGTDAAGNRSRRERAFRVCAGPGT